MNGDVIGLLIVVCIIIFSIWSHWSGSNSVSSRILPNPEPPWPQPPNLNGQSKIIRRELIGRYHNAVAQYPKQLAWYLSRRQGIPSSVTIGDDIESVRTLLSLYRGQPVDEHAVQSYFKQNVAGQGEQCHERRNVEAWLIANLGMPKY